MKKERDCFFRAVLDLAGLEGELTHSLGCNFQDGGIGSVSLLVTKSGTTASETISDLPTSNLKPSTKELETIQKRYVSSPIVLSNSNSIVLKKNSS